MHENIEKIQFYKDSVRFYKYKQRHGHEVDSGSTRSDGSLPPQTFDSTVITLSKDIFHKFEKLTFAGKK